MKCGKGKMINFYDAGAEARNPLKIGFLIAIKQSLPPVSVSIAGLKGPGWFSFFQTAFHASAHKSRPP